MKQKILSKFNLLFSKSLKIYLIKNGIAIETQEIIMLQMMSYFGVVNMYPYLGMFPTLLMCIYQTYMLLDLDDE